jgi:cytochrome c oxidase subunit II
MALANRRAFLRWLPLALAGCRVATRNRGPTDRVAVGIVAADTSWSASYLPENLPTGRDVHVPLGAEVSLALSSRDFVALFSVPSLGLRDFASPGLPGTLRFRADREGSYELRADELCGQPHGEKTRGRILVEEPAAFWSWIGSRTAPR